MMTSRGPLERVAIVQAISTRGIAEFVMSDPLAFISQSLQLGQRLHAHVQEGRHQT